MFRFNVMGNINGFYWVITVIFIKLFLRISSSLSTFQLFLSEAKIVFLRWNCRCFPDCRRLKRKHIEFKTSFINAFFLYILTAVCSRLGVLDIYRSVVKRVWKAQSMQKWDPVYTGDLCISNASLMLSYIKWDQRLREGSWLFHANVTLHYSMVTVSFVLSK